MGKIGRMAGLLLALPLLVGLQGCSRKPEAVADSQSKAFQSASAETKALWEQAASATKSNDYVTTIVSLRKVRKQADLTPEQLAAVDETLRAVNDKLNAAATSGDAAAKQAIQELQKSRR